MAYGQLSIPVRAWPTILEQNRKLTPSTPRGPAALTRRVTRLGNKTVGSRALNTLTSIL